MRTPAGDGVVRKVGTEYEWGGKKHVAKGYLSVLLDSGEPTAPLISTVEHIDTEEETGERNAG